MSIQSLERRTLVAEPPEVEIRESGANRIGGYAAVYYRADSPGSEYGLWDGVVERIMPGAFDKALERGDDVRALFNHEPSLVLGRSAAGTLRLETNKRGLRYEVDLPDTQAGRDVMVSIQRGDVSGSSFAFLVEEEAWKRDGELEIREIRSVSLLDVSPVTYPAYTGTTATMRAEDDHEARRMFKAWHEAQELERQQALEEEERAREERERCYKFIQARLRLADIRRL